MPRTSPASSAAILFCFLVLGARCPEASAQGTRADYDRAAGLRARVENKVFRDRVRPHWLSDGRAFWYRIETAPRCHQFILVDLEKPERNPAFDHVRLATALKAKGVEDATPDQLPIDRLEFDRQQNRLVFRCGNAWWACDLASYTLEQHEPKETPASGFPPDRGPRQSRETGESTEIAFVNKTEAPSNCFGFPRMGTVEATAS